MNHPLDNPAFNALSTGNKYLSNPNETAKHFSKETSPFIGLAETTKEKLVELYNAIPYSSVFVYISSVEVDFPEPWIVLQKMECLQMVCENPTREAKTTEPLIPLTDEHIPAMLALTKLTAPGPFSERTIDFGHYKGIFDGDKLVAMAGQRLNPTPYAEISAVCTHPDYLGRGYAAQLLLHHVQRIKAASGIPFLHVLATNSRAISVYHSLGFETRKQMNFYIIKKS
jgi:predicted GNAT family acetyltransferase